MSYSGQFCAPTFTGVAAKRFRELIHPSLSKLELVWSNQPQLKILHVETEDQGYSVLQLRPGTAKQIKYFLKRVF